MPNSVVLRVKRYRPDRAAKPFYQDYTAPYREDDMVLDVLNRVKNTVDGSLTFRWSCRMGICGSCGATVNGKPLLTCETFVKDVRRRVIRVEPLDHFPVIKDLVVDIDDFMRKLPQVKPWLLRRSEKMLEEGEYRQRPDQVEAYLQHAMCINCMICYSACPVYGLDREFLGPAALSLAHRYNEDSRDQGAEERIEEVAGKAGVWDCTFVGECSVACPKDVEPALAIQRMKARGAMQLLQALAPIGR